MKPINYDNLARVLWELSKSCPKEYESALMHASVIVNDLKHISNVTSE